MLALRAFSVPLAAMLCAFVADVVTTRKPDVPRPFFGAGDVINGDAGATGATGTAAAAAAADSSASSSPAKAVRRTTRASGDRGFAVCGSGGARVRFVMTAAVGGGSAVVASAGVGSAGASLKSYRGTAERRRNEKESATGSMPPTGAALPTHFFPSPVMEL